LGQALERRRESSLFARALGRPGRDVLTTPGETVELSILFDSVLRRAARGVRFYLDGSPLAEVSLGEDREEVVRCHYRVAETLRGLYQVTWKVLGPGEVELDPPPGAGHLLLHVVTEEPVLALPAAMALAHRGAWREAVEALLGRGWAVFVYDLAETDRSDAVREALERHGLDCAVLSLPSSEAGFQTLGVDFRPLFLRTALRRLHAAGVPVVAAVAAGKMHAAIAGEPWLAPLSPDGFDRLPADRPHLEALEARARAFVSARDRSGRTFAWRLDQLTRTPPVEGNSVHVELDNRKAREAVFEAIEAARRHIHLQLYILDEGYFADHLAVRLIRKAREGVAVRVLLDAVYAREGLLGLRNKVAQVLSAEPGIEVLGNDPIPSTDALSSLALKHRDHRKLLVVDGVRAFVSGRNGGDVYYLGFDEVPVTDATPHARIPWLDAHAEVEGPLVTEVQRAFLAAWKRSGGTLEDERSLLPPLAPLGDARARLVLSEGVEDANVLGAYEALFDGARDHVFLLNDFPIFADLASAVRRALARGVRVVILTGSGVARRGDRTFFDGPLHRELFEYMTKARFEPLVRDGAELYEYATGPLPLVVCAGGEVLPYVHAKLLTADGRIASVGSANVDATASYWEREANVLIEDAATVAVLEGRIARLLERSHPVDPESEAWRGEAGRRALVARLWPEFLYS
ncbi:MAG: phosphatidylserine/phosphatidylglycerophosphate/cardiolipin synthase family protein, partial [Deltaproteobacteria bacterium]